MPTPPPQSPASSAASADLVREIDRVVRLHRERQANPALAAALERVGAWQARRLHGTYPDLASHFRYAPAIAFFETDLYSGRDFAQRDTDLQRVIPIMVRMSPERVIAAVAKAMELNALSQELDRALLSHLPGGGNERFSVADYCIAYRRMGNRNDRELQIRLLAEIGEALDGFVRKPLIRTALAVMRQPARLAGVSALHNFLERGFHVFRRMGGARVFLETIVKRETALMDAILGGDMAPFADPSISQDGDKVAPVDRAREKIAARRS